MSASRLLKLDDTDLTVSDPRDDIRGRWVIDGHGEEIGYIDALLIDERERKVRFLQIAATNDVGVGEQRFLLPANAITWITDDEVVIDQSREVVAGAPPYDPDLTYDAGYYSDVYAYYSYTPFWTEA